MSSSVLITCQALIKRNSKDRLARVMKAQQKGGGDAQSLPSTTPGRARKAAGAKRGRKAKDADGGRDISDGNDTESSNKKPPKLEEEPIANGNTVVKEATDAGVEDAG